MPAEFAQTVAGDGVIAGGAGFGTIVTVVAPLLAAQPEAFVTVSVRLRLPDRPAVYVMA